ncbi:Molybdenum cofactor sulfurase [Sphaceloma murrayae]|uniref:Molybdenum cofactor sulfurase n=1 Tax=Sphaceloma murrayae TaxID=2082308 RepID=A0A2K1QRW0_9PEZI|nr:Molybdenum cofactor sulfurase [Sphaceloma murrayae]
MGDSVAVMHDLEALGDLDYNAYIEGMRREQYPMLGDALYLDHAGTTLTSKLLLDTFHSTMVSNLYGNPHSFSQASQRTAQAIDGVRIKLLSFLQADPRCFDVVFTANATAGIKFVAEAFRDHQGGFEYGYHNESHTSLVGIRELARASACLTSDEEVEEWLAALQEGSQPSLKLFAYPAQSNLNGKRFSLRWPQYFRNRTSSKDGQRHYTLLDAAALLATCPLDLRDAHAAPDFIVLSLYKIFGFPDLGALIVRRDSADVLQRRTYFGGGSVDLVINKGIALGKGAVAPHHIKTTSSIHASLEDGTLPYHSILALDAAFQIHAELFGSLDRVSRHTAFLADRLYRGMVALTHENGAPVVKTYYAAAASEHCRDQRGPVVSFNLLDARGDYVSLYEFEKLAFARNINVRTGGLCNPGGIASHLELSPVDQQANFDAGHRCGTASDVRGNRPTGMIRASLGAMSTLFDVSRFVRFLEDFYVEGHPLPKPPRDQATPARSHYVESITVYPIKSCAGWSIPQGTKWSIRPEGLAWDREWCVVNAITGKALSQKRYPRMVLIRPELDERIKVMRIRGVHSISQKPLHVEIPMSALTAGASAEQGEVCGAQYNLAFYDDEILNGFFTDCIGIPCRLARFVDSSKAASRRHAKDDVHRHVSGLGRSIALSNESPILTITRASLDRLNEKIKQSNGKAASPAVFRANIVLADGQSTVPCRQAAFAEDGWEGMRIGGTEFEFLGGCRRCQMVCIDQCTGEKNEEPFSTLAKTRRINSRVMFGVHTAPKEAQAKGASISTSDEVSVW